jgi:4-hydroxy-tetrahydrodipicolinate reductase
MKYALVGYGKMGRAIEVEASARGHACCVVVDKSARGRRIGRAIDDASWRGVVVAFEFTRPDAAKDNVVALLRRGVPVVCGTTGWDAGDAEVRKAARESATGCVIAPNFSVGMSLFYAAVDRAARSYLAVAGYDPWVAEWHHKMKADAPSGTARRLAATIEAAAGGGTVPVVAVRAGHEFGRHVVGFDGPDDAVTLEHVARGRAGFARGAVLAAEWIRGKRGVHGFGDVVADLVRGARRRGEKR